MADYQAFNYGTPQELADRAAAWQGYGGFDMGAGSVMPQSLRNFLNTKIYPTNNAPTPPPGIQPGTESDYEWHIQNGFTAVPSEFGMGWDYPSSNAATAGQYQQQMGQGAYTSPDGRYYAHQLRDGAGYMIDDLSRGANEPTMGYYDPTGNFTRAELGAKNMTNWQGVLSVVGAALGMGALGAGAGAAAGAGEAGAAGSGAGFVGEGAASGIGAWDGALAGASGGAAAGATGGTFGAGGLGTGTTTGGSYGLGTTLGGEAAPYTYGGSSLYTSPYAWGSAAVPAELPPTSGSGGGSAASTQGTPPPANPNVTGTPPPANPYVTGNGALGGLGNILTGAGTAGDYAGLLTSLLGAYAGSQGQTASTTSTKTMDPRMDALFYGDLAPAALGTMGAQMPAARAAGQQMMTVGSGLLGQTAPTTATNPYLSGVADDMQRRTADLLGQNNLAIQGNFVGTGGLGGSRQGVAQGVGASKAADYLQGNVANLYGTAYAGDQNRLIQQQTLGAGLLSQGLDTQFQPLKNTGNLFSPFNGFGTTNNTAQQGGGVQGALGGALGAAQYGHNAGWW